MMQERQEASYYELRGGAGNKARKAISYRFRLGLGLDC
jgi:hypothetical protein